MPRPRIPVGERHVNKAHEDARIPESQEVARGKNKRRSMTVAIAAEKVGSQLAAGQSVTLDMIDMISMPPEDLPETAKDVWKEFIGYMPAGVLRETDRAGYEAFCILQSEMRRDTKNFSINKWSLLINLIARFGMTPLDRKNAMTFKPAKNDDPGKEFGL